VLAVAIVLFLVAVGLGVQLVRTNARLQSVREELAEANRALGASESARRVADGHAAEARRERDEALERVSRARRDAADVAKRMKQEAAARAAAEVALADAEAAATGSDEQAAELWRLAVAAVQRTWEISVSPSPGVPSPLAGADDELRAAIGIEVDAAHEEMGASIDLDWSGATVAPPALAVRALALVQELIGRVAKVTDGAVLHVTSAPGQVTVEVSGTDIDGAAVPVDALLADVAPDHQVGPGRFELTSS
jgi:trimeric autotransporter adhesin